MSENKDERKLPGTIKGIVELIGLEGGALRKMGDLNDLVELFQDFNEGNTTIEAVDSAVTAKYINSVSNDDDVNKGTNNLLEEIRAIKE